MSTNDQHHPDCTCQRCRARTKRNDFILAVIVLVLIVAAGVFGPGCSTVVPDAVKPAVAGYDGNDQNSGILGIWDGAVWKVSTKVIAPRPDWMPPGAPAGIYVTPHFRDRFNELVDEYGEQFKPKLTHDVGLTERYGRWIIDREHMVDFLQMNSWRTSGRKFP